MSRKLDVKFETAKDIENMSIKQTDEYIEDLKELILAVNNELEYIEIFRKKED